MVSFGVYALLCAYFIWRLTIQLRRHDDIRNSLPWLTLLAVYGLLWAVFVFVPGISLSQPAAAALLIAAALAVVFINLYLFRRYDRWLKKQETK